MQTQVLNLSEATEDEIWAIWRGEFKVNMTPEDEAQLYHYCGQEFYDYVLACEEEEELAKYRGSLGYDPYSGVDEGLCLEAFISIYEERRMSVIEDEFPDFLKYIKSTYAEVCHEQDFQDFLADYWDYCTTPEPKTMNQDLDALWDQIAAAHNRTEEVVSISNPQVKAVWIKQPAYSEMGWKAKPMKSTPLPSFEVYPWYTPTSPKYQSRM